MEVTLPSIMETFFIGRYLYAVLWDKSNGVVTKAMLFEAAIAMAYVLLW